MILLIRFQQYLFLSLIFYCILGLLASFSVEVPNIFFINSVIWIIIIGVNLIWRKKYFYSELIPQRKIIFDNKKIQKNIITIFLIVLMLYDRGFTYDQFPSWEESRLIGGMLSSVILIYFFLYAGEASNLKIFSMQFIFSTLVIIVVGIVTGSRILVVSYFVIIAFRRFSFYSTFLKILSLAYCLLIFVAFRYFRGGDWSIDFSINSFDFLGGELEIFDYIEGAVDLGTNVNFESNSILQNILIFLGPYKREIIQMKPQELLWQYHYNMNMFDLQHQHTNLVQQGGIGSHHPTYFYEYYIGLGLIGGIISIPFSFLYIYLLAKIFNKFKLDINNMEVLVLSSALFFVRGNSIIGFTQLIMGIGISFILSTVNKLAR